MGRYKPLFETKKFKVITERCDGKDVNTAFITVCVENTKKDTMSKGGGGPVDALNKALRKVLVNFYPYINKIRLTDFKVRIIDGDKGTEATTRVLIEFTDGGSTWTTMGVDKNIITASYEALVESIEYGLINNKKSSL